MFEDDIDNIKFIAKLEHDGWIKEIAIHEMMPDIHIAVLREMRFFSTLEESLPEFPDIEKVTFRLAGIEKVTIQNKIKTYYLKYDKRN
jgi:hypothetical protein